MDLPTGASCSLNVSAGTACTIVSGNLVITGLTAVVSMADLMTLSVTGVANTLY
jgi:hypothetical protein